MIKKIERIFVDTSAWIAYLDAGDGAHKAVEKYLRSAVGAARLITSDFVIFETLTYLNCSLKNHKLAGDFYESVQQASGLDIAVADSGMVDAALKEFFFQLEDQPISVVDAVSFYIMKKLGLELALALDKHFIVAGFRLVVGDNSSH